MPALPRASMRCVRCTPRPTIRDSIKLDVSMHTYVEYTRITHIMHIYNPVEAKSNRFVQHGCFSNITDIRLRYTHKKWVMKWMNYNTECSLKFRPDGLHYNVNCHRFHVVHLSDNSPTSTVIEPEQIEVAHSHIYAVDVLYIHEWLYCVVVYAHTTSSLHLHPTTSNIPHMCLCTS